MKVSQVNHLLSSRVGHREVSGEGSVAAMCGLHRTIESRIQTKVGCAEIPFSIEGNSSQPQP